MTNFSPRIIFNMLKSLWNYNSYKSVHANKNALKQISHLILDFIVLY